MFLLNLSSCQRMEISGCSDCCRQSRWAGQAVVGLSRFAAACSRLEAKLSVLFYNNEDDDIYYLQKLSA